jgi:hypothetical protein
MNLLRSHPLLEEDCLVDESPSPPGRPNGMHMGVGGQDIFVNNPVAILSDAHSPFHMKNQITFISSPIRHPGVMKFMASDL